MSRSAKTVLDLTKDIAAAVSMGTSSEQVDELLGESVETLGRLVPFDLATVMERVGDELRVRIARGPLASEAVRRHRLPLGEYPSVQALLESGDARAFEERDHRDGDGDAFDGVLDLPHGHSCMVVPLRVGGDHLGIITFDRSSCGRYEEGVVQLAGVFGKLLGVALSYGAQSTLLGRLHRQLQEQNRLLKERLPARAGACELMEATKQ